MRQAGNQHLTWTAREYLQLGGLLVALLGVVVNGCNQSRQDRVNRYYHGDRYAVDVAGAKR